MKHMARRPDSIRSQDSELVQIVDAALEDSARRSGPWLACRPGCTQCCMGVFAISQLDALRLQRGLSDLAQQDPVRADRVRQRAGASISRLRAEFPGDPSTGILGDNDSDQERFEEFANHEPCPALNPVSGTCDLYQARPMTCRVFGPPVRSEGGLGVCELCFHGASPEQIAACELHLDTDELEERLARDAERITAQRGNTIVAFALASRNSSQDPV